MTQSSTELTVQKLENWNADKSVNPPIMRRGIMGKASDGSWYNISVDTDGNLQTEIAGVVDDNNSTATVLDPSGVNVFTGTSTEILNYGIVFVNVSTDVASATDGLSIQQSSDGTNWDHSDKYTVPAGGNKNYSINPFAKYVRVVYTNGGTIQGHFRLQTVLKGNSKPSSHRIQDPIIDDDDAELVTSVLKAKANGGGYVNIEATASNNLRVTDAESGLSVAKGDVTGHSFIHKFGAAPNFDVENGFVTVWDGAEDGAVWELMNYVYSTSAAIDSISSTNDGDTQDVEIQGLDANYDLVIQTITLTGNTRKALTTDLIRVFRVKNVNSSNFAGHVIVYENDTTGDDPGVPDDSSLIRSVVHPENNQTEMAVFTVPDGYTGYMRSWYASTAGAKRDSSHTIKILARPFGQVFQLKHKANIDVTGTSYIQHEYVEPEVFAAKTDIEMQMDTDIDAAGVAGGFDIVLVAN
ncbi:MAG: hypothetical protein DRN81_03815 [Thermoproteota archaeon]|nr:MAG: hypothetical protein DRN81_03815 [Candidatus Korarchaeota archaeon]